MHVEGGGFGVGDGCGGCGGVCGGGGDVVVVGGGGGMHFGNLGNFTVVFKSAAIRVLESL